MQQPIALDTLFFFEQPGTPAGLENSEPETSDPGWPEHQIAGWQDLKIVVPSEIDSPQIWAAIANLSARIAFQTLCLDSSIVRDQDTAGPESRRLTIKLSDKTNDHQPTVTIEKTNSSQVAVSGTAPANIAQVLNCLATTPLSSAGRPCLKPGDRLAGFGTLTSGSWQLNSVPVNEISLSDAQAESDTNIPGGYHISVQALENQIVNTLDFSGLYTGGDDPLDRQLSMVWAIGSSSFSHKSGLALCEAVTAMAMEATAIHLPLIVTGDPDKEKNTEPAECPCFWLEERSHSSDSELSLAVIPGTDPGIINISGTSDAFSKCLVSWVETGLEIGVGTGWGPGSSCQFELLDQPEKTISPEAPDAPILCETEWQPEQIRLLKAFDAHSDTAVNCDTTVWTSKPKKMREQIAADIRDRISSTWDKDRISVFNAFKPGLCRILDTLEKNNWDQKPDRVVISYQPFPGGPDSCIENPLEFEHRWLHEVFPAREVVADRLDIPESAVTLAMDDTQKYIYKFEAYAGQVLVFRDEFSPLFRTMDYMPGSPELASISPCCAGIFLVDPAGEIVTESLPTDRDIFWETFQTDFVPRLIQSMEDRIASSEKDIAEEMPAFFDTIKVDVWIDESDDRIGFMDEQISPMEKLHEDIYFYLLDMFTMFSKKHGLPEAIRLGQILPQVSASAGEDGPRARMTAIPATPVKAVESADRIRDLMQGRAVSLNVTPKTLSVLKDGDCVARMTIPEAGRCGSDAAPVPDLASGAMSEPLPEPLPDQVPWDRLLTADHVHHYLERLNKYAGIRVWQIAVSLKGRPIYAVEAVGINVDKIRGRISIPRLRMDRPTVLFNARHHANEISSTNAVLSFLEFLTTPEGKELLKTANVACIPLENVDGVATFESLYRDGSCDILHAARYNALGTEFYAEYFNPEPVFPEALAKARLWQRWLPELMADLHGVPGHEWCQPYAGYLPKNFEEFWIPRAFVYVHLPFLEDPDHPMHGQTLELAEEMRTQIAQESDIAAANKRITALYNTYARGTQPEIFPPADSTDLTALPLLGRARQTNYAVQHPDITRSEVIVEVPDEVAYGDNLALCVKAHFKLQEILTRALTPRQVRISACRTKSGTLFKMFRFSEKRPWAAPGKSLRDNPQQFMKETSSDG